MELAWNGLKCFCGRGLIPSGTYNHEVLVGCEGCGRYWRRMEAPITVTYPPVTNHAFARDPFVGTDRGKSYIQDMRQFYEGDGPVRERVRKTKRTPMDLVRSEAMRRAWTRRKAKVE